jgi:Smr domain
VGRERPKLRSLWNALDEAAFGAERILNLRESLPTAAEARARADVWLRARQVTKAKEVLVITGRGNQSIGGVGIIRKELLAMLPTLKRRGVVENWREHTPGSFVIQLAPMTALLEAPRRRRGNAPAETAIESVELAGLKPETLALLRQIASQNLMTLGITESQLFLDEEMLRTFSKLIRALPTDGDREAGLQQAISKMISEGGD